MILLSLLLAVAGPGSALELAQTSPPPSAVTPVATASPLATQSPTIGPSPFLVTTPGPALGDSIVYNYRFVPYPPKNAEAPRVFAVYLNDKVLHAPGPIDIRIDTSPDVTRVIEHTGKKSYPIAMVAPGRFVSAGSLPKVPFVAHGVEVKLNFEAIGASGESTSVVVPFSIK